MAFWILDPLSFTMEFGGTLPLTNSLNGVGPNNTDLRGEEILILTLEDGTRFFILESMFFDPDGPNAATESQDTFDIMDDFPNGAHNLNGLFVCYVAGTQIKTPTGNVAVEDLIVGDRVLSEDSSAKEILFVAAQFFDAVSINSFPKLRPVTIPKNSVAPSEPREDLLVSPRHRILIRDPELQVLFGLDAAFVAARDFPAARPGPASATTYVHLLCETHTVIRANGCESETLFPGDIALLSLSAQDREAVRAVLDEGNSQKTAYPCLTAQEAAVWRSAIHNREKRTA